MKHPLICQCALLCFEWTQNMASVLLVSLIYWLFHCRLWTTWMVKNWMAGKCMWAAHRRKESARTSSSANLSRWNRIAWPDTRFVGLPLFCRNFIQHIRSQGKWWKAVLLEQKHLRSVTGSSTSCCHPNVIITSLSPDTIMVGSTRLRVDWSCS